MNSSDQDTYTQHDYEAECHGCDIFGPVDSTGLCIDCARMLERDLLRQRAWDYTHAAYVSGEQQREEIRKRVIAEYGQGMELIADEAGDKNKNKSRRWRRRKSRSKRC